MTSQVLSEKSKNTIKIVSSMKTMLDHPSLYCLLPIKSCNANMNHTRKQKYDRHREKKKPKRILFFPSPFWSFTIRQFKY